MAILLMLNATPVHWHCKRQSSVETATFGGEVVAARTTVVQMIDLHLTLVYLGVPINPKSYMSGDNKAVITNATILLPLTPKAPILLPTTEFKKQLQQGISSFIRTIQIQSYRCSWQTLGFSTIWRLLQPLLSLRGVTSDLATKSKGSDKIPTKHVKM